ncbi:segregation and condensation protein A [Clostridium homopropionicum DSM 5847]|uniref:Segregation and condensation protein A n=1 Tax=Clostridium homopropionicum DSM 5847 TaxID=1121318 RepID=A0A0L6ZD64_9CLOT|nr:segregation/condensation protein A [Clostridium homopropionicum]KOA20924.1 segregation and condensation protein A [Clostridium homopropionicum DSM 5847]SFG02081.1 condensin subunit ScpA [Clostridium homopropionicum]
MSLNIKIDNFEGPFDLLLHLIKKNQMDIYDIKIYDITNQYLKVLENMKEIDLEVTSEFILIAATLLEIKSKMLLPKESNEEEEEDLREELISKLLEYKKFKMVANYLKEKEENVGIMFSKKPEIIEDNKHQNKDILKDVTIIQLFHLYNELINNYISKQNKFNVLNKEIPVDKFTVEDKIDELSIRVKKERNLYFSKIIYECESKMEMVVTFLALLELIRLRAVSVVQDEIFSEIYIEGVNIDEGK